MTFIRAILLLGLALSDPAFAADKGAAQPGKRLVQPAAETDLSGGMQPLHARGPGALFTRVDAVAIDALLVWGALTAAISET